MLQDVIYENYGLVMERQRTEGAYQRFFSGNALYTIVPISEVNEDELMERLKMSHFMQQQGDQYVSSFVMSRENTYLSEDEGNLFILTENLLLEEPRSIKMGSKLAKFHSRGHTFAEPIKVCNRIGKWKELWENRIDTIEGVWREKLQAHPINDFERLFVESFPYYLGLGENAIQYLVDCEIDENPTNLDAGTVCHERFYSDTWSGEYLLKNPFDWVFDHQSRDIGEWLRQHYHHLPQTYQPSMVQFMNEYQSYLPLSGFSWRLLYARLLFPVHYLEAVESYFSSRNISDQKILEEHLQKNLDGAHHHEEFLRYFYEINEVPVQNFRIPKVDWL
ncbi:spore coat putative kinase YutH [Bacillus sp. JJ722]|uniref:spore coat putative kinase YutH n=1 Tax=Bacillus sp. JJ722 TaxID=3122973 RepID=UPI002FFF3478